MVALPVTIRAARGSRIEVDGTDRGAAPLFGLLLSPGSHRIAELSAQGTRVEVEFQVDEDNLQLDFTREAGAASEPVPGAIAPELSAEPAAVGEVEETRTQRVEDLHGADAA